MQGQAVAAERVIDEEPEEESEQEEEEDEEEASLNNIHTQALSVT
jgi:hypothetical protein